MLNGLVNWVKQQLEASAQAPAHMAAPVQQASVQHPNFYFQANPNPQNGNEWQFLGGHTPVSMPQVQIPQNVDMGQEWGQYGDAQGNKWMENNDTGQRIQMKAPTQYDVGIPPPQMMPGQFTFPVQHIDPSLRRTRGIGA